MTRSEELTLFDLPPKAKEAIETKLGRSLAEGELYIATLAYNRASQEMMDSLKKSWDNPRRFLSKPEQAMEARNPAVKDYVAGKITFCQMLGSTVTINGVCTAPYVRVDPACIGKSFCHTDLKKAFTLRQLELLKFSDVYTPGEKGRDEE